jgi:protein-disulfide isomerase
MMTKLKNLICLIFIAASFTVSLAQSSAPKQPASAKGAPIAEKSASFLPTNTEVETALKRTLGYDPGLSWQIIDIRPAAFPGVADVVISINKQAAQHVYFSAETQKAIIGEMIPFGNNPFAPVRAKLQGAFGPNRGGSTPAIEIVEFSDLECPHCKVAQPILEKLTTDFPQVRFTFQQFPLPGSLHPWAMKASLYADCAGQMDKDSFWKFVDAVFENQGGIALATADDKLKELATANGYDAQKIAACAASPEADARIKKSLSLGELLNVNQTPTVFINGRQVLGIGGIPYENLKALVQFEIDHAGR